MSSTSDTSDTSGNSGVHPAQAFWQALTHFDSTKVSYHRALRNAIGVALPLIVGFALHMPRGGLVVASGALNVSYSDGSDPYPARARRMLASTFLCAIAVFAGAISGHHQVLAVALATIWAFFAGMSYAVGGAAPDLGVITLVILLIYAAQPLTSHEAALSGLLAMAGGLLQTGLSVALWPVHRYEPERRALANLYQELSKLASAELNAYAAPPASAHSEQAQEALMALNRDAGPESLRYQALLNQAERVRLSLLMLSRLRYRMEKTSREHEAVAILTGYLEIASRALGTISGLLAVTSTAEGHHQRHEPDEPTSLLSNWNRRPIACARCWLQLRLLSSRPSPKMRCSRWLRSPDNSALAWTWLAIKLLRTD